MLTISPPPELEEQLRFEAQKRGVAAEELTVEALRIFLQSNGVAADAESARLAAIEKAFGYAADVNLSSEDLHRERREDAARDEAQYQRQLGNGASQ